MRPLLLAAILIWPAAAGTCSERAFPSSREFFNPLLADPMELAYGGRMLWARDGVRYGEVMMGDYVGLFRWTPRADVHVQLNLGGGGTGKFSLSTPQPQMDVLDFTGTIPIDVNVRKRHTLRAGFWHTSSHLGDDYIRRTAPVLRKRTTDRFRAIYSYDYSPLARVYGGASWAVNQVNIAGRRGVQGGLELRSAPFWNRAAQFYLAQDFQSFERVEWNPSYTGRVGARLTDDRRIAAANIFVEYFSGKQPYLQFFDRHETRWAVGLTFEIGNPLRS